VTAIATARTDHPMHTGLRARRGPGGRKTWGSAVRKKTPPNAPAALEPAPDLIRVTRAAF